MNRIGRIVPRLRARLAPARAEERGIAMVSAILFTLVILSMGVLLTSVLIAQPQNIFLAERGTQTADGAQAGAQIAIGQIRSATGTQYGDASKLPCSITGTVAPTGSGSTPTPTYTVNITYFPRGADPSSHSSDTTWISQNKISGCPGGAMSSAARPYYALIKSTATGVSNSKLSPTLANRSVSSVYDFKTININIPGGRISNRDGTACWVADSATAGSKVTFKSTVDCNTLDAANSPLTKWVYDKDYEIKLASTLATSPLCVTDPGSNSTQDIQLQPCLSTAARWGQLWNWTGDYSWRGENSTITAQSSSCLAPSNTSWIGYRLQVNYSSCTGQFAPSSQVGPGAASYATHQIVNYLEFGRCMDVTGEQITAPQEISYPCKQDATGTGAGLNWNHKWYYQEVPSTDGSGFAGNGQTAPQQIYVYYNGIVNDANKYCLTTPSAAGAGWPNFILCSPGNTNQLWTRVGIGASYAQSYLFIDKAGRCIGVDSKDLVAGWSTLQVQACDGTTGQKWNAPPNTTAAQVGDWTEPKQ